MVASAQDELRHGDLDQGCSPGQFRQRVGDNCRDVAEAVQRAVTQTLAESAGRTALVEVTVAEVALR